MVAGMETIVISFISGRGRGQARPRQAWVGLEEALVHFF